MKRSTYIAIAAGILVILVVGIYLPILRARQNAEKRSRAFEPAVTVVQTYLYRHGRLPQSLEQAFDDIDRGSGGVGVVMTDLKSLTYVIQVDKNGEFAVISRPGEFGHTKVTVRDKLVTYTR
jgi:hypothetical protein